MSFRLFKIVCHFVYLWLNAYLSKFLSPLPSNFSGDNSECLTPPPPHTHTLPALPIFAAFSLYHQIIYFPRRVQLPAGFPCIQCRHMEQKKTTKAFSWMLKCTGLTLSRFLHLFPSVGQISTSETQFWKHFRAITVQWRTIPVSLSLH